MSIPHPFVRGAIISGKRVDRWAADAESMLVPLAWRKARHVIVITDLFHESVPDEWIDRVFGIMALANQHTFQVLTKRPERALKWMRNGRSKDVTLWHWKVGPDSPSTWPLGNVWLGVSVEDQDTADERIPLLLQAPAAVRFVSAEPLLGEIRFSFARLAEWNQLAQECGQDYLRTALDLVIVGGESGPRARPCEVAWIRSIIAQCQAAGVACFVKQLGAHIIDRNDAGFDADLWQPTDASAWPEPAGGVEDNVRGYKEEYQGAPVRVHLRSRAGSDPAEWPADLRVREFPQ